MLRGLALFPTFFLINIPYGVFAAPLNDAYQEGINLGKANQEKAMNIIHEHKPTEIFKDYTQNPSQAQYYHGITNGNDNDLRTAGEAEYKYDEDDKKNNGVQAALKSFKQNSSLPYRIDPNSPNDPIISRAKNIMHDSKEEATCKESAVCHIEYEKKKCNEQTRTIKRLCEKKPEVTIATKNLVYPNCQKIIVVTDAYASCPAGYSQILYSDMIKGVTWDDIRFCTKTASIDESSECYSGGYYIAGFGGYFGSEKAIVPKKMKGRIKLSQVYSGKVKGSIINETTGELIRNNHDFKDGDIIELPYSENIDQTFKFYMTPPRRGFFRPRTPGVMILYVDHVATDRVANISWKESCRDI